MVLVGKGENCEKEGGNSEKMGKVGRGKILRRTLRTTSRHRVKGMREQEKKKPRKGEGDKGDAFVDYIFQKGKSRGAVRQRELEIMARDFRGQMRGRMGMPHEGQFPQAFQDHHSTNW